MMAHKNKDYFSVLSQNLIITPFACSFSRVRVRVKSTNVFRVVYGRNNLSRLELKAFNIKRCCGALVWALC